MSGNIQTDLFLGLVNDEAEKYTLLMIWPNDPISSTIIFVLKCPGDGFTYNSNSNIRTPL